MFVNLHLPLLLPLLSAYTCRAATDCFTQVGDYYTKPAITTHRVSIGIDCPDSDRNNTCPLQTGGYVTESAILNITTNSTPKIFDAVRQKTGKPFYDTITGSVTNSTVQIEAGKMGYWGWTVTLRCSAGTLGDCIGGDVKAGTAIEACTPSTLEGASSTGFPQLDGTGAFVATDNLADMQTNPSASPPPAAKASNENAESTAMHLVLVSGTLGSVVAANLVWQLF
ncbi:MAG: hypothetical protein Q9201_000363 [Fulgogasparrea decipioides]